MPGGLDPRRQAAVRMWTDGDKLYSYEQMIGYTHNYEKVVKICIANTGYYLSHTTSTHCNMASKYANVTISPSEWIPCSGYTFIDSYAP